MRLVSICFAVFSLASASLAQMTPGIVVSAGERFPLIADYNGDGLDDLFNSRSVVLNTGTSFADAHDLGIGKNEEIIGVLDVKGDHTPDLLTFDGPFSGNTYRLYIADASRNYGKPIVVSTNGVRPYIADVDGDGKDDLVLMQAVFATDRPVQIGTDATVLRSRGDGTFDRLPSVRLPGAPQIDHPRLEVGDLDHDGLPDIVIRCNPDLAILHGLGGGRFSVETRYMPNANMTWGVWNTRLADIDGDGNLDIVTVGFRTIHVLFGDGHGNFPRYTSAKVAQLHPIVGAPPMGMDPNTVDQPRDIATGHFTRTDRDEIAADTMEGDLVIFAYDRGALSEVSRMQTGFFFLDILPGHFHDSGLTDLCVYGTLDQAEKTPPPRIFYGTAGAAASAVSLGPVRRRSAAAPRLVESVMHLQTHVDCLPDTSQEFAFHRDGVFAHAETADALFDGDTIYFRVPVPGVANPLIGAVTRDSNGGYSGIVPMGNPVGQPCATATHQMTVTATINSY